jgi:phosphoribosylformylglycinamidine (FGAM) synthase PurS component
MSKIRRPASNFTDYIASQTADFVIETPSGECGVARALTINKLCTCGSSFISPFSFPDGSGIALNNLFDEDDEYQQINATGFDFYVGGTNYGNGENGGIFINSNNILHFGQGDDMCCPDNYEDFIDSYTNIPKFAFSAGDRKSFEAYQTNVLTSGNLQCIIIKQIWADLDNASNPTASTQLYLIRNTVTGEQWLEYRIDYINDPRDNIFGIDLLSGNQQKQYSPSIAPGSIILLVGNATGTNWTFSQSTSAIKHNGLCRSCTHDRIVVRSNSNSIPTVERCDNPTIDLTVSPDFVTIEWQPVPGATSYSVVTNVAQGYQVQVEYDPNVNPTSCTLAQYDQELIYIPDGIQIIVRANPDAGCGSAFIQPCFLRGSLVNMADGTTKAIEDVQVNDLVIGAFGEINKVLALHRPMLGTAKMCKINDEHSTTNHHPHVSLDKKFYCGDPDLVSSSTYGHKHKVIDANGNTVERMLDGLNKERIQKLEVGVELKTIEGSRLTKSVEVYSMPEDTQLYNLVIDGSHTYHVDGYAVTGWPSEHDFDYDNWVRKL